MSAQVYYDSPSDAAAVVPVTFTTTLGNVADPSSVTCVVTDPAGTAIVYNYLAGPNNIITRSSSGNYALSITGISLAGLYTATWIGTGNGVSQVSPTTFRVVPLSAVGTGMNLWYTGREELKSRLNITDNNSDYEIQLAIQAVANWINSYCGRTFYQVTETRTYCPDNVWELAVDDIVSTPAVVSGTVVKIDYDGDGIYETTWTQGLNYQLKLGTPGNYADNYNVNAAGVPRPYTQLQVLQGTPGAVQAGGGWLPFTWPYTRLDRVQIATTWGWPVIPPSVQQASLLLCTDVFKSKDAPWGIAGTAETGLMRVQSNPWAVEFLHDYVNTRRKVGVLYGGCALNILCAYTDLRPETKKALDPWNPEYVNVSLSPLAYWSAVRERWTGEHDLINIEHDVVVHEQVVPEFTRCDRPWCTFPYPCAQGGQFETAAGCARYSKYLQQLIPAPEIERAVHWAYCDCPPECSPGICWHHMDAYLVEAFQRYAISVHLHEGAVGHV